MPQYCTIADLLKLESESFLAALADDENSPPDLEAANTQAVLSEYITEASDEVYSAMAGRFTFDASLDPVDSQLAVTCKRLTKVLTLAALYKRQGHVTPQSNPFLEQARLIRKDELPAYRRGDLNAGSDPEPARTAFCTTTDRTTVAMTDADGDTPSLMEGF